ncbi:MAG: hypothetical protein AABY22_01370 [Nanoarchaeota archaeon]
MKKRELISLIRNKDGLKAVLENEIIIKDILGLSKIEYEIQFDFEGKEIRFFDKDYKYSIKL